MPAFLSLLQMTRSSLTAELEKVNPLWPFFLDWYLEAEETPLLYRGIGRRGGEGKGGESRKEEESGCREAQLANPLYVVNSALHRAP